MLMPHVGIIVGTSRGARRAASIAASVSFDAIARTYVLMSGRLPSAAKLSSSTMARRRIQMALCLLQTTTFELFSDTAV